MGRTTKTKASRSEPFVLNERGRLTKAKKSHNKHELKSGGEYMISNSGKLKNIGSDYLGRSLKSGKPMRLKDGKMVQTREDNPYSNFLWPEKNMEVTSQNIGSLKYDTESENRCEYVSPKTHLRCGLIALPGYSYCIVHNKNENGVDRAAVTLPWGYSGKTKTKTPRGLGKIKNQKPKHMTRTDIINNKSMQLYTHYGCLKNKKSALFC